MDMGIKKNLYKLLLVASAIISIYSYQKSGSPFWIFVFMVNLPIQLMYIFKA